MQLSYPQSVFVNGLNTKFGAYVGGFGSGKTMIGCFDLLKFAGENPKTIQGYFAPTARDIRDIFYPSIAEVGEMMGFTTDIKVANKEVHLYRGRTYYGTIICRAMHNPETIVGFKIARALCDEIDTLPADKAKTAWDKIIARLRLSIDGVRNDVRVTTTPEGFKFVYNQFSKNPTERYSMVQASTYENEEYLPDDYIDSLLETYSEELATAYINGEFTNLTSGTVYKEYDRVVHRSKEQIQEREPLYIGCDFNVTKMAATVYVKRGGQFHAAAELYDMFDTPDMIGKISERYDEHNITIYPDSSGRKRGTVGASQSDISLLKGQGWTVKVKSTNPFVRDRVLSTNKAFKNGLLYVNDTNCPRTAECLEQQSYDKNGEPDKKSGNDHQNDATTYPIVYEMPIIRPVSRVQIKGF